MTELCLQERYAPESRCFGCGPSNSHGLRLQSFLAPPHGVVACWNPAEHHQAFAGILSGGICGTLLDCHSNWTAAHALMLHRRGARPPVCVTARYQVELLRPTPLHRAVVLRAHVQRLVGHKADVQATLHSGEELCARCTGTFVAVGPGHPAYGKW